jgi:hypothetical protein
MRFKEFEGTHVHIDDQLNELTFQGSQCTKDCRGHQAGYKWSLARGGVENPGSTSPSFNKGAAIAARFIKNKTQTQPQVK